MFKVDMGAILEAAIEARLMANPANVANPANSTERSESQPSTGQQHGAHLDPAVTELLDAAMRACDAWNDTALAREQMRQDVLQTPPHLRADLLDHLDRTGGGRPIASDGR